MNEFLTRFGLTEIIEYLLPGMIALCAILPWASPDPNEILGTALGQNQFVLAALVLVAAYACGLALSILGLRAESITQPSAGSTWIEMVVSTALTVRWFLAQQVRPPLHPAALRAYLKIGESLRRLAELPPSMDNIAKSSLLRALAADRLGDKIGNLIAEAENQRRRFMFSLGVALALLVFGGSALARLAVQLAAFVWVQAGLSDISNIWWLGFATVTLLVLAVSVRVAARQVTQFSAVHARRLTLAALSIVAAAGVILLSLLPSIQIEATRATALTEAMLGLAALLSLAASLKFRKTPLLAGTSLGLFVAFLFLVADGAIALVSLSNHLLHFSWVPADLVFWENEHAMDRWWGLGLLVAGAFLISRLMRRVAGHCLAGEIEQTLAIGTMYDDSFGRTTLVTKQLTELAVDAPKDHLWIKIVDYVRGPRTLRIQGLGMWGPLAGSTCNADGDPAQGFDDGNLHKTALRGCLLAKIGGGGGDTPAEGNIHAVGSDSTFDIPEGASGGLFVTMNDNPRQFHQHSGSLTVTVWDAL